MKTSKKLLSFFLALVMIITGSSLGFTAYAAQDGNKTDSNADYWNNQTDAESAFETINTLLGMVIQLDAVKNLLEENNIVNPVTQSTTLSDVVYGASPMLLNVLGGLGTLNLSVIGGPTVEVRMKKSDFLKMKLGEAEYSGSKRAYYDKWYEPLDGDEEDFLDFYALYGICQKNQDADGDFGKYCKNTLKALDDLFDSIPAPVEKPVEKAESEILMEAAQAWLDEVAAEASPESSAAYMLPVLEDYENATYNGVALKDFSAADIADTDGKYLLDYYNNAFSKLGLPEITNLAELLYYAKGDYAKYNIIYQLYFDLIAKGDGEIDLSNLAVDGATAREVADNFHGTTDYWTELNTWGYIPGLNLSTWDDSLDGPPFEEYFDAYTLNQLFFFFNGKDISDISGIGDIVSGYYKEMTKGMAVEAGLDVDGLELTDAQWNAIASCGAADAAALREYVNGSDVSDAVKGYFNALPDDALNGLAADGAFSDGEQSTFDEMGFTTAKDRINAMVYSQALIDNVMWQSKKSTYANPNITSEINVYQFYLEYIANDPGEEPDNSEPYLPYEGPVYEYVDYAFADELVVDVVNAMINDLLALVDMDLIQGFFSGLTTDVDLRESLTDLWKNLYNHPAETVFELIPLLTVLVDELILPLILHEETGEPNMIEDLLMGLLGEQFGLTQAVGGEVGIGQLHFDLNKSLPAILHFLTGDQAGALAMIDYKFHEDYHVVDDEGNPVLDEDGNPIIYHYDNRVPRFLNIYLVDGFVAQAGDGNGVAAAIAGLIKKDDPEGQAELAQLLGEPITEVLIFLRDAVDTYLEEHGEDTRYNAGRNPNKQTDADPDYVVAPSQKGLNNLSVALPQLIDIIGKQFNAKYMVDSDWTFTYDGKIEMQTVTFEADRDSLSAEEYVNTHFQTFKDFAAAGSTATPADILSQFIDLLIGNWINSLTDFLNDLINDENNMIAQYIPLLQGLLEALGGFDDDSIITDALNGLFQLKRSDDASFTLTARTEETTIDGESKTNFSGFSIKTGFFLINNVLFVRPTADGGYEQRGLIPFIKGIIDNNPEAAPDYDLGNVIHQGAPTLEGSKKNANTSAAGTNYDELLTSGNIAASQKLVDVLDTVLGSALKNAKLNGFKLDSTENLLTGAVSLLSAYFGEKNSNDIIVLLNDYLYYVCGESKANPNKWNVIGNYPTKGGDVDYKRVYTSANLSNLVIQTYSLLENIIDYFFYSEEKGVLRTRDPNMLIADALYGIVSPDAVGIRLADEYEDTKEILAKKDYLNWNDFKVEVGEDYYAGKQYNTVDHLKYGFKDGDKDAFYDALGESLSGIAGVLGAVLVKTYVDPGRTMNWYSNVLYPIFGSLAKGVGSEVAPMDPAAFNEARPGSQLVDGLIRPVGGILAQLYDLPFSFILNLIKGLAGVLDDASISMIVKSLFAPINNHVTGLCTLLGILDLNEDGTTTRQDDVPYPSLHSPHLALMIKDLVDGLLNGGGESEEEPGTLQKVLAILMAIVNDQAGSDIVVNIVNNLLGDTLGGIKLPAIDWKKLNSAKSPAEVLLLVYAYVVDSVLNSGLITGIIDSLDPELSKTLSKLSAAQILAILAEAINAVNSPVEVYWTFREYADKLTDNFSYPKGITAAKADAAVDQLDQIVKNVFPLLNGFGVTDIEGLDALVNEKLYTNENITAIAKALYGALTGNDTVTMVLGALSLDVSPAGLAKYLTDKSYGKTFSGAASTLKNAKNWDSVKSVNWGFKNGASDAQTGFINGLAAALRPLNNVLGTLLAENKLDITKIDLVGLVKSLNISGSTTILGEEGEENAAELKYTIKNGQLILTIRSWNKQFNGNRTRQSVLELDLVAVAKDIEDLLANVEIGFGTNGYESAIIPLLEAFMCPDIKTYKEYKADYAKAKDNLLINILKPIGGLLNNLVDAPFDTLTAILPNVAYFIDNGGIEQAVGNLLAPITAKDGLLGVLAKNGLDIDKLIYDITGGKTLGSFVSDLLKDKLGIEADIKLDLNNLAASNIHEIVIPLVINLLKDKLGITLPEFTWADIAKHGVVKTVASKARNDEGKFTTLQVQAKQGEVLVAVLRYVADVLIKNAQALKALVTGLDAIKNNKTLKSIVESIFDQIAQAKKDDIVLAIFYLLCGEPTDRFFDYRNFKIGDYEFSFGDLDEDFCRQLAPMLDGLIGGLLEGGLTGLVETNLYKDDLVAKLATGLYGAVEGVKVGDNTLTNILAMTDIDFSTAHVAELLTNNKYGRSYAAAAATIRSAGSWKNVKAENLKFGVTDRDSFLHALTAVLRPIFGVLDVLLNDAALNLFDLVSVPGSDGYTSTIVPLLEALGVYNVKTQYQYREDIFKEYDSILLDILNPLWDKVEDVLAAPLEIVADILPNLALFFANDGLIQLVDNLLTPVSALLDALRPIVDINAVLKAAGLDVPKLLKDKVGLSVSKFDLYDLPGTLKPLVGANNVTGTLNAVLKVIKIGGAPLGIELPEIDWLKLASCGEYQMNATSQAATFGGRIAVKADQDEALLTVLRFLVTTINYKDNYDAVNTLARGLLADAGDTVAGVVDQVLGLLQGDTDEVIQSLIELLQALAG